MANKNHSLGGYLLLAGRVGKLRLPKRRASIDHAPGPSIARLAQKAPRRMFAHAPVGEDANSAIQIWSSAAKTANTGIHRPARRKAPTAGARICCTPDVPVDGWSNRSGAPR